MPTSPPRILVTWVGQTDLDAAQGKETAGLGPIGQACKAREFDLIVLLSNYSKQQGANFLKWLEQQTKATVELHPTQLSSPTAFAEIYQAVVGRIELLREKYGDATRLTFHLSPGTSAMAAVWIIVAKTRFGAELLQSSREHGVQTAEIPFDISAELVFNRPDRDLERLTAGLPDQTAAFEGIVYRSPTMKRVIAKARSVAIRSVPVLIEGESGTGKELFARAIHNASQVKSGPFIPVNCGAIPAEIAESEFFGHKKDSFTGARADRKGHFEAANAGTLFLDEVGELPAPIQTMLLRALQQGEITRVGESITRPVKVRVIAATNRSLAHEVSEGRFREDLFYRIAVAVLRLPPIRERSGDLSMLIEHALEKINRESAAEPAWEQKKLSVGARNLLMQHGWPGNVRELMNTLTRAAVWSPSATITPEDVREALLESPTSQTDKESVLDRSLSQPLDLREIMGEVAHHYITRSLEQTHYNKTKTAELLGFKNYQTLTSWMKKYGIES